MQNAKISLFLSRTALVWFETLKISVISTDFDKENKKNPFKPTWHDVSCDISQIKARQLVFDRPTWQTISSPKARFWRLTGKRLVFLWNQEIKIYFFGGGHYNLFRIKRPKIVSYVSDSDAVNPFESHEIWGKKKKKLNLFSDRNE